MPIPFLNEAGRPICPYCDRLAELVSSKLAYGGKDYGPIWACMAPDIGLPRKLSICNAWTGVHKGTTKPLGRLANARLRSARTRAHLAFDPLWKRAIGKRNRRHDARNSAYIWLAQQLGIPFEDCHIGYFDVPMCIRVVEIAIKARGMKHTPFAVIRDFA